MRRSSLALVLAASAGCVSRTAISPVKPPAPAIVYVGEKRCMVYDFTSATDVPDGAKNLGWVGVKQTGTDEETYVALRTKICEMDGDALSQAAWVREPGDDTPVLKANTWSLP